MSSGSGQSVPGSRRRLTNDQIVAETLALVDEQGIAAASMRTVARRLGVRVMTLYRYVDNREQLFDAVVDHIVDELGDDAGIMQDVSGGDWEAYLTNLAWGCGDMPARTRMRSRWSPPVRPARHGSIRRCAHCAGSRRCCTTSVMRDSPMTTYFSPTARSIVFYSATYF